MIIWFDELVALRLPTASGADDVLPHRGGVEFTQRSTNLPVTIASPSALTESEAHRPWFFRVQHKITRSVECSIRFDSLKCQNTGSSKFLQNRIRNKYRPDRLAALVVAQVPMQNLPERQTRPPLAFCGERPGQKKNPA